MCTNQIGVRRKSQKRETAVIHRNNPAKIEAFNRPRYALGMAILSDRFNLGRIISVDDGPMKDS